MTGSGEEHGEVSHPEVVGSNVELFKTTDPHATPDAFTVLDAVYNQRRAGPFQKALEKSGIQGRMGVIRIRGQATHADTRKEISVSLDSKPEIITSPDQVSAIAFTLLRNAVAEQNAGLVDSPWAFEIFTVEVMPGFLTRLPKEKATWFRETSNKHLRVSAFSSFSNAREFIKRSGRWFRKFEIPYIHQGRKVTLWGYRPSSAAERRKRKQRGK